MLGKCFIFELHHEPTGLGLSSTVINSELWTKNKNYFLLCFHVDYKFLRIRNYINVCLAKIKTFDLEHGCLQEMTGHM